MEAIGRLAGAVAHDFNNLLTAIVGYADMIAERTNPDETLRDAAEIRKVADRAAALTRQLLAFSRKQFLDPVVLDLNEAIGGLLQVLPRVIGERIHTQMRLGDGSRADQGRRGPDRADAPQPRAERARRDAGRRRPRPSKPPTSCWIVDRLASEGLTLPAWTLRDAPRVRHRHRHGRLDARPRLRAVLHHQAEGQGHRSRSRHGLRHRRSERRTDRARHGTGPRERRSGSTCRKRACDTTTSSRRRS